MGGKSSKDQQPEPKIVTRKHGQTKKLRLLVLHKKTEEPDMDEFCDALNTYPPRESIELHHGDVRKCKVQDDGTIPDSEKNDITAWISDWLTQGRIVLICLLTDFDHGPLNNNDNKRVIVFCFKNPPVDCGQNCICIDVDFETDNVDFGEDNAKLSKLANKIKGDGQ